MDPNRHQIVGKIWENHDQPLNLEVPMGTLFSNPNGK